MNRNYHLGMLYLVHLLISADGEVDESELQALQNIRTQKRIPVDIFQEFERSIKSERERDIYRRGIELINTCSKDEKMSAFVTLYKLAEADGRVHIKEVKLLLYSIEMAGIEFDDVVNSAKKAATIL